MTESPSSVTSSSSRRKKRRRKRARLDTHLREEASSSSDEKESLDQDVLKEESLLAARFTKVFVHLLVLEILTNVRLLAVWHSG